MEYFAGPPVEPPEDKQWTSISEQVFDLDDNEVMAQLRSFESAYSHVMKHARETLTEIIYHYGGDESASDVAKADVEE